MRPIGKYILIEPTMEETETESGILLTMQDNNEFRYRKATVVEAGTDVDVINSGDIIYYDGTNFVRLAIGTAGQVLTVNVGATAPEWQT